MLEQATPEELEQQDIAFFESDVSFSLENEHAVKDWIRTIIQNKNKKAEGVNFIFCSDEQILKLNRQYLDHDYYTDILTFPNSDEEAKEVASDIYISLDTVRSNAEERDLNFVDELHRVMIHGVLHLLGYDDHAEEDVERMRQAENLSLSLRQF